ncbi:hypothetical protein [Streptococcus minor]|uniref:hypothetical protein n=1 Tax=Streptococcus minor TaxID=229549 RepID=UPI00037E5FCC|nr:hypothetical protein [Streptococcus minor]
MATVTNVTSWEMEKAIVNGKIEMPYSKRQGAWVAEIVGPHPTYKLDRKFIDAKEDDGFFKIWEIKENVIYCICPSIKYKEQYFVKLENNELKEYTQAEIIDMVK